MKIVVITGSPRKNGNSDLLAKAFVEGAEQAGNEVMLFEAGRAKINGCMACNSCFTRGTACSFDDDFNTLAPMLAAAGMVVFCTPLYWFGFPAQLKSAIDKLYSFMIGNKKPRISEAVLMVCAETGDAGDFRGIITAYELMLNYLGWKNRGILTVPNVNKAGDIQNTSGLEKAKNIGLGIA
jgi:multimeric flavodoxin WrbA